MWPPDIVCADMGRILGADRAQVNGKYVSQSRLHDRWGNWPRRSMASRVEDRRSGVSLPVAVDKAFAASPQSGLAWLCFLSPLIEPGLAVFPHPALGKDSRFRPRKARDTVWQLHQTVHRVQRGFRKTFVTRSRLMVFVA